MRVSGAQRNQILGSLCLRAICLDEVLPYQIPRPLWTRPQTSFLVSTFYMDNCTFSAGPAFPFLRLPSFSRQAALAPLS